MAPLLVPVEIIGLVASICARRPAFCQHLKPILLAVLLPSSWRPVEHGSGLGIGAIVVLGGVAINLLELFVAFLQAFILRS
jgi:F0F1-type ATP synthase membrane subunit a